MTTINIPIEPGLFWPLLGIAAFVLAVFLVYGLVPRAETQTPWLDKTRKDMGLETLHPGLFAVATLLYGGIFLLLFGGLCLMIYHTLALPFDPPLSTEFENRQNEYRNYLLSIAGLTTVLGAVIALPFTLIRLKLTQQQTKTNEESLFNEKINGATELLYARRLHTERDENSVPTKDVWQDDITRRNAAIDRLERLADERPDYAPDIARMLSIYVRELTAENPAKEPPADASAIGLGDWARSLKRGRKRTDMENAVQTLGRMITNHDLRSQRIDLRGTNLQGFDLNGLCFDRVQLDGARLQRATLRMAKLQRASLAEAMLQRANLSGAQLQGASLRMAELQWAFLMGAQMQRANLMDAQLQGAKLDRAQLQGASLTSAQLQGANLRGAQLQGASLSKAQLQGVDLRGAKFDTGEILRVQTLRGAALTEVDFSHLRKPSNHFGNIFADATVTPPGGARPGDRTWPRHWPTEKLDLANFNGAWRAWQRSIGFSPFDP